MTIPKSLFVVNTTSEPAVRSEFVTVDGEPYICIRHVDQLSPFLMSVVSDSDHWLFVGSNSPFTAGRIDPDNALFLQLLDAIDISTPAGLRDRALIGLMVFSFARIGAALGSIASSGTVATCRSAR